MSTNATDARESIAVDDRTRRALAEYLTVLPDTGRAKGADGLYLVISQSGSEYLVDARGGACECPDARHRNITCKHQIRCQIVTGNQPVSARTLAALDVDPSLGEHVDGELQVVTPDGGELIDDHQNDDRPAITKHVEPACVGGARYLRCEGCGREVIGRDERRLLHWDDCPHATR